MRISFIALLITCNLSIWAQNKSINGRVVDAETGVVLPFASISFNDYSNGSVSNSEGVYVIDIPTDRMSDSLYFSYMGYETLRVSVKSLMTEGSVSMHSAQINLAEIPVYSQTLSALDIIKLVQRNFTENHPQVNQAQRLFYHSYNNTPFSEANKMRVKKTSFVDIDQELVDEVLDVIPEDIKSYRDVIVDFYSHGVERKIVPIEGISLQESTALSVQKKIEEKLLSLTEDIELSFEDDELYYKMGTGIFSTKLELDNSDSEDTDTVMTHADDSTYYLMSTEYLRKDLKNFLVNTTDITTDNLEFINKPKKYNYRKELTLFNGEWVYKISFEPKEQGIFQGVMYIAAMNYAVLQFDYEFATGKSTENINLLGIGHKVNYKKAQIIYEKVDTAYFVKYVNAEKREFFSIDRNFFMVKKKNRFLFDKALNKIKFALDMQFETKNGWELLVIHRQNLTKEAFEGIEEPKKMAIKKELVYSPDMWEHGSVIVPNTELKNFRRGIE
jgi:hypothetical protein